MRIIIFLLKSFFALLILSIIGFLITREALLYWGKQLVVESLYELRAVHTGNKYAIPCSERSGTGVQIATDVVYQLKFLNSREYIIEAVCDQFSANPITIAKVTLPAMVTKKPGGAGFVWQEGKTSSVELVVFDEIKTLAERFISSDLSFLTRSRQITVDNLVIDDDSKRQLVNGEGPVAVCAGYGFTCCDQQSEFGVGEHLVGVLECEKTCFSACQPRPVLLSFTSRPFYDAQTRTLTVTSGTNIEFAYVADNRSNKPLTVILNFGDGNQDTFRELSGGGTHNYTCKSRECTYKATVTLEDEAGVRSVDSEINHITIKVTQN